MNTLLFADASIERANLKYNDSSIHCYDPTSGVEIGLYIETEINVFPGIPDNELYRGIEKNKILISHPDGAEYIYSYSVLAMTDGNGNSQYSASWVNSGYRQIQVINLYYSHNSNYIRGSYIPFSGDKNNVYIYQPEQTISGSMDCLTSAPKPID